MNKNYYKDYFFTHLLVLTPIIILFISYQYLYGSITYCDELISSTDKLEPLFLDNLSQERSQAYSDVNCSTLFYNYQEIARRKLF